MNEMPRVGDEDVTSGVGRNELSDGDGGVAERSGRSRFKDITKWKCQMRKSLRNSGQSYVRHNVVRRRPKLLKPGCGAKCRQRCHDQIPAEQRENLLHLFWELGNLNSQRQYILNLNHTAKSSVKTKLHGTKKVSLKMLLFIQNFEIELSYDSDVIQQAVFKLYLQDGREYLWQCSNKEERDVWAMSISATVRALGSTVQVFVSIGFKQLVYNTVMISIIL